jgi:arsenate reductase (glutaredoxin)
MSPSKVKSKAKLKKQAKTGPSTAPKKTGRNVQFLHKPNCSTCRNARKYMENRGFHLDARDLGKNRLTAAELEKLIGDRDHTEFLNTRNELYRQKKMKENPPSREDAIRMMATEPNLIRRPVILAGGRIVLGFDREGIARI